MESLWGNEDGWGNVSEECSFSAFDVAAAMQTEHICGHTFTHTHAQECMTVNHGCDVCVWVEDEEKGQRALGDVVYSTDRETRKESRREREELGTAHL